MSGQQHAVMWLGILLIVLRLFTTSQWTDLKAIFGWSDAGSGSGGSGSGAVLKQNPDPLSIGSIIGHAVSPIGSLF